MEQFIQKYDGKIMGVLTGFDRLVFRGTLRALAVTCGMMDFLGIGYERRENCFPWIENVSKAQDLMDKMLRLSWPSVLEGIRVKHYYKANSFKVAGRLLCKHVHNLRTLPSGWRGSRGEAKWKSLVFSCWSLDGGTLRGLF